MRHFFGDLQTLCLSSIIIEIVFMVLESPPLFARGNELILDMTQTSPGMKSKRFLHRLDSRKCLLIRNDDATSSFQEMLVDKCGGGFS